MPPELTMALNYQAWGVDIRQLPAGLLPRMNAALNAYNAMRAYRAASGRTAEWARQNPDAWEFVARLLPEMSNGSDQ